MDSAFRIADQHGVLDRGKFIISGTADELATHRSARTQFVHGLKDGPLTDRRRAGGYEEDLLMEKSLGEKPEARTKSSRRANGPPSSASAFLAPGSLHEWPKNENAVKAGLFMIVSIALILFVITGIRASVG